MKKSILFAIMMVSIFMLVSCGKNVDIKDVNGDDSNISDDTSNKKLKYDTYGHWYVSNKNEDDVSNYTPHTYKEGICSVCNMSAILYNLKDDDSYEITGCLDEKITSINIPQVYNDASVTSISVGAFSNLEKLKSVSILNNIRYIESSAFLGCSKLSSVEIGSSVKTIGSYAFSGCTSLSSITIPSNVVSIGNYIFNGCTKLESITLSTKITEIPEGAFLNCYKLTSITIPANITKIADKAFNNCYRLVEVNNLSKLSISTGSSNYGYIGYYAKLVNTTSKSSIVKTYNDYKYMIIDNEYILLDYTGSKTDIILPDTLNGKNYKLTFSYVFYNSNLTSVMIPTAITGFSSYITNTSYSSETKFYYKGTLSDWNTNIYYTNYNIYYYSATKPTYSYYNSYKYWHYVSGVVTVWE